MPFVPDEPNGFIADETQIAKSNLFRKAWGEVSSSAAKRFAGVADTFRATAKGEITPMETGIQTVGAAAGFLGDVASEAIIGSVKAVTPEIIEEGVNEIGMALLQSSLGKQALKALSSGADAYLAWKTEHPRAAKNIESVVNIASFFPAGKAISIAAPEVKAGILTGKEAALRGAQQVTEQAAKIAAPIQKVTQAGLETGERIGEALKRGSRAIQEETAERAALRTAPKEVAEATRIGIPQETISRLTTATPETKPILQEMAETAKMALENPRAKVRPIQIAGQRLADRASFLATKLRETGKQLGVVKQTLKGKKANVSSLQSELNNDLEGLGLVLSKEGRVVAQEGVPIADDILEVMEDLNRYLGGVQEKTAINLDRLRQFLFKEYSKQGVPLRGQALGLVEKYRERLLKTLSGLDKTYGSLAADYAQQRKTLSDFTQLLGFRGSIENIGAKSLRAGEVAQRILGQAADRPQSVIDDLVGLAEETGYKGKEDIYDLIKFADELEDVVKTQTRSLGGQMQRGIEGAISRVGVVGKAIETASRLGVPQAREQLDALIKLLGPKAQGAATPKQLPKTPDSQRVLEAFAKSKNQKNIGTFDGVQFEFGSFGEKAAKRKSGLQDRFPAHELENTVGNITQVFRASKNATSYRLDNLAWMAEMPDGEIRFIYTRKNARGAHEVLSWHKWNRTKNPNYLKTLESFGAPGGI